MTSRKGCGWIEGTSNHSDYISHFVANHIFYRLSVTGARRVLLDTIEFLAEHVPTAVGCRPAHAVGRRDASDERGEL